MVVPDDKIKFVALWIEDADGYIGDTSGVCSQDMVFFRSITAGQTVLMGRKTFEGIGRTLPGRHNLVVGTNYMYLNEALIEASKIGKTCFIIGGSEIFNQTMNIISTIYRTVYNKPVSKRIPAPPIPTEFQLELSFNLNNLSTVLKYSRRT